MKKVLVFAGSNSSQSINQQLAVYASTFLREADIQIIELRNYQASIYSYDLEKAEGVPAIMQELNKMINEADAFIIGLPEYNSSMTAIFKNTIDWNSRISWPLFQDKPVLLTATSGGKRGAKTNLDHLATIMPFWGAKITGTFSLPEFGINTNQIPFSIINAELNSELMARVKEFEAALS